MSYHRRQTRRVFGRWKQSAIIKPSLRLRVPFFFSVLSFLYPSLVAVAKHTMSHELSPLFDLENSPASPLSPSLASSPSLPSSKLKRLSLVAKPRTLSLYIEREIPVSTASVKNMIPPHISSTSTGNRRQIRHSVTGSPAGITYSPSPVGTGGSTSASSMDMRNGENLHPSRGAYSQSIYGSSIGFRQEGVEASRERIGESEESQTLDPQTFMDRWFSPQIDLAVLSC